MPVLAQTPGCDLVSDKRKKTSIMWGQGDRMRSHGETQLIFWQKRTQQNDKGFVALAGVMTQYQVGQGRADGKAQAHKKSPTRFPGWGFGRAWTP